MPGLRRILVLAHNTYREAVREKLLYNLLLFAALMILSSILLAKLHLGYDKRIYYDVGLSAIALFGALIAIFVGINLVYREISQKTSTRCSRSQSVAGNSWWGSIWDLYLCWRWRSSSWAYFF